MTRKDKCFWSLQIIWLSMHVLGLNIIHDYKSKAMFVDLVFIFVMIVLILVDRQTVFFSGRYHDGIKENTTDVY